MTYPEALEYLKNLPILRISVGGDIGSGKSTFAKRLAEELDMPRVYAGGLMREEAAKRGITLDELGELSKNNPEVDKYLDQVVEERSQKLERGIFEGRLAWNFTYEPDVRFFMQVDPRVAAERVWGDNDNPLRDQYGSVEEIMQANEERKKNEEIRYHQYYGLSAYDLDNYDVVFDSTHHGIEQTFEHAVIAIAEFLQRKLT